MCDFGDIRKPAAGLRADPHFGFAKRETARDKRASGKRAVNREAPADAGFIE